MSPLDQFTDLISQHRHQSLMVVTGAGISLASGIPTFRGNDKHAIWKRDLLEMATNRYFKENPVGSWSWYLERFGIVFDAQPNAAHRALVDLENWQIEQGGDFLLVTQNVDTLHEDAGSSRLVKVHGSADKVRCSRNGCVNAAPKGWLSRDRQADKQFQSTSKLADIPTCPACGSILRQHVLWFDEYYTEHTDYQFHRVQVYAQKADCVVFIGTSFSVGITEMITQAGQYKSIPMVSIDPNGRLQHVTSSVKVIEAQAEELLPQVMVRLRDSGTSH